MSKKRISDKKVVLKIAKILIGRLKNFSLPADMDADAAIRSIIEEKAYPLITYGDLAAELNEAFDLKDSSQKFTALMIDDFLGILLKESIRYEYSIPCVVHNGSIRKKFGRDIPITAIVVNDKKHVPGRKFYSCFNLPHANDLERSEAAVQLMKQIFTFKDWKGYTAKVKKVFDDK